MNFFSLNYRLPLLWGTESLTVAFFFRYWDALYDLEKDNGSETEQTPEDDTPAWVRCSSSDLYLTKDPKVNFKWINNKARFHVTNRTQINKSLVYFIIRGNINVWCDEC